MGVKANFSDTIAGVSSAIGGPISIIRISGTNSLYILKKIFSHKDDKPFESHRIYYGWIDDGIEKIDEVLVSVMLAPKTFTRENIVEINCHGGTIVVQKILLLCVHHGARLAEPGEFTMRAFLNGRIDLSQAEAVMDIINAKSQLSHKTAVGQLQGRLAALLGNSCDDLLALLARIEMAIDYPEHDEAEILAAYIKLRLEEISSSIDKLLATANQGRIIREGIKTAIIGLPNVGKSSLLNVLANEDRAIVTHIAGTTRDVLRETIKIDEIFLEIADTAGIRQTDDIVENHGVDRSIKEGLAADLVLLVVDGSEAFTAGQMCGFDYDKWHKTIVIVNKTDLPIVFDAKMLPAKLADAPIVEISAKEHKGIDALNKTIEAMFLKGDIEYGQDIVTNTRHIALLSAAKDSLQNAIDAIDADEFIDLVAIDIQAAFASLGAITGIVVEDELIEKIFSEFCLGK